MKDNYFKKKKKFELLNEMYKLKKEAFIYQNMTKEMIEEFNRGILTSTTIKNSLDLKHKSQK